MVTAGLLGSQPVEEPDHCNRDREQRGSQNQVEQVEHRASCEERSVATPCEINNASRRRADRIKPSLDAILSRSCALLDPLWATELGACGTTWSHAISYAWSCPSRSRAAPRRSRLPRPPLPPPRRRLAPTPSRIRSRSPTSPGR